MRHRHVFTWIGSAAVLSALFFTDPDHGVGTGQLSAGPDHAW